MLIQTRRDQVHNNIEIEEDTTEVVDNFTYLGVNLADWIRGAGDPKTDHYG